MRTCSHKHTCTHIPPYSEKELRCEKHTVREKELRLRYSHSHFATLTGTHATPLTQLTHTHTRSLTHSPYSHTRVPSLAHTLTHTHTLTATHTHSHTLAHTFTHLDTRTHSHTLTHINTLARLAYTRTLTHTQTHSHTRAHKHSFTHSHTSHTHANLHYSRAHACAMFRVGSIVLLGVRRKPDFGRFCSHQSIMNPLKNDKMVRLCFQLLAVPS